MSGGALLAEVTRRDVATGTEVVESTHRGHVVVVAPDGTVAGSLGDAGGTTFVRSTIKPFQLTACLEILDDAGDGDELTDADLAIAQASHRGEPGQLAAVESLLARSGTPPDGLTTPVARPEAQPELPPARLHYNCSGKHAMFALAGRALGSPRSELLTPDGPVQRRVLAVLEEVLGPPTAVGVDGCGAPAVAVPLVRLADAFRRLRREERWARACTAALAHGRLVGGAGRLDSALLDAGVSAKQGAEGVYGAAWTDVDGGHWGIAVKCEDGGGRGADVALLHTLAAAGVVAPGVFEVPPPTGGGDPAGSVRPSAPVLELGRALVV